MRQQMLHLDGHVVGQIGKLLMHSPDDTERMRRAVKEVRIPEGDMPRARRGLLANVPKNNLQRDDAKPAIVDGHHRTVPAQVLTTAACLHITGYPPISVRQP